ncbi:type II toxin-antitoxin system PemK/MazF family toxin [Phytomonospora endophytica]|uniref:mRNA interferase MazF n=1 Tax=Phytomonospora endophytica TaxID=714109 RepID=A0A841FU80_9ACTN|nr:type II toxin-antitoxin system PemK/MazF family toxin [Phytomonospora endophytica]MBB6037102.1 mRNA interferase MazF [Phytomonospora endophytica]GIG69356.1 hypothetical protein Pen01_56510 [Phytomonospora endophytica]
MSRIRPWEVWYVDLGEPVGHEQGGSRPGVVVGSALHCRFPIQMAIFVPLTTTDRGLTHHVPVFSPDSGLAKPSFAMTEQPRTLSTDRLEDDLPLGMLVEAERREITFWLKKMVAA